MRGRGGVGSVPAVGRPKRERKVPAHLKEEDVESVPKTPGTGRGKGKKGGQKTVGKKTEKGGESDAKEGDDEMEDEADGDENEDDDDGDSDGSWVSEDDPDRLWCICQQPHNNK